MLCTAESQWRYFFFCQDQEIVWTPIHTRMDGCASFGWFSANLWIFQQFSRFRLLRSDRVMAGSWQKGDAGGDGKTYQQTDFYRNDICLSDTLRTVWWSVELQIFILYIFTKLLYFLSIKANFCFLFTQNHIYLL